MLRHYRAFGLVFRSPEPLPSLAPSELPLSTPHDVEITYAPVTLPKDVVEVDGIQIGHDPEDGGLVLWIEESGKFKILNGRSITVHPDPGATPKQVHTFLLGSVFGAILHQRSILPIHCNAIEMDGATFLFCGDSGAGKSTLAAFFQDRGYKLLTDDVCALRPEGDGFVAWPGIARLKLWGSALSQLGRTSEGLPRVPWTDDKFELPIQSIAGAGPYPVAGIYHLREAEDGRVAGIHRLHGLEAVNTVTANIYRRRMADLIGAAPFYLDAMTRIIKSTPIFTMNRNWGLENFETEALNAETHMREIRTENAR